MIAEPFPALDRPGYSARERYDIEQPAAAEIDKVVIQLKAQELLMRSRTMQLFSPPLWIRCL